jgi:DNA modification methylase
VRRKKEYVKKGRWAENRESKIRRIKQDLHYAKKKDKREKEDLSKKVKVREKGNEGHCKILQLPSVY